MLKIKNIKILEKNIKTYKVISVHDPACHIYVYRRLTMRERFQILIYGAIIEEKI